MSSVEHGGRLTGIAVPAAARRRVDPWMLLVCALLSARGGPVCAVSVGAPSSVTQGAATKQDPIVLNVQITLALSGLHPAVTQAGLDCGAIAQSPAWVEGHRGALVDYDSTNQVVLRPAHYLSQESVISLPITGRKYSGPTTVRLTLAPDGLSDPVTHRPWAPKPAVLIACWLTLNGRPATWDRGSTALPVTTSNFSGVSPNPMVVAVADATGPGPVTTAGRLSVQGQYFVPAPVAVAATVQLSGAATAPLAEVPGTPLTAAHTPSAPIGPAASASSAPSASTRVPAPLTLSAALTADRSTRLPIAFTLTSALSAAGGTRLPRPLVLSGMLSAASGTRLPTPIALNGALIAQGGTHLPAPITLSATLTAGGAMQPALVPRTQPATPLPK